MGGKVICYFCNRKYYLKYLAIHFRIHTEEKPYKCDLCDAEFPTNTNLGQHLNTTHNSKRLFPCSICSSRFKTKQGLQVHEKVHTSGRPFSCPLCSSTFKQNSSKRSHIARFHTKERPHKCIKCAKVFVTHCELNRHSETHLSKSERPSFSCNLCKKVFSRKNLLDQHKYKVHNPEKPFPCTKCPSRFKTSHHLVRHQAVHSNGRPFPCPLCPKAFKLESDMKPHILRVHTKERCYGCNKCAKVFVNHAELRRHSETHLSKGKRPRFSCNLCKYAATLECNLKRHVRTVHLQLRPHSCLFCGKTFSTNGSKNAHISTVHCKEMPHKCPKCGKLFGDKGNLTEHIKAHRTMEERAVACDIPNCSKVFLNVRTLREHIQSVHEKLRTKCSFCGKSFGYRASLRRHQRDSCLLKSAHLGSLPSSRSQEAV